MNSRLSRVRALAGGWVDGWRDEPCAGVSAVLCEGEAVGEDTVWSVLLMMPARLVNRTYVRKG